MAPSWLRCQAMAGVSADIGAEGSVACGLAAKATKTMAAAAGIRTLNI